MTDLASVFLEALTRPVVICDIDGILADYESGACEAVNGHFGTSYSPMAWWEWDPPFAPDECEWLWSERHTDPAFFMAMSPHRDAIATLTHLVQLDYRITVSSERPVEAAAATVAWLDFYGVPRNDTHLQGAGGKVALCSQHGPSNPAVLIDDSPRRWVDCAGPGVNILAYIPPHPHFARPLQYPEHVQPFSSFNEVPALVGASEVVWPA